MGLLGNLTAGEIVEQLAHALQFTKVRNVVFMGMGEPLDNYAAVSVRPFPLVLHRNRLSVAMQWCDMEMA
jgi:adenine C2-methylase RlmN of 23S rRNA A2503 and tRNA A37